MKKTARENFEDIKAFVIENNGNEEYVKFLTERINQLDSRAKKARERAAEKKATAVDPFIEAIAGAIGSEPITADDIVAALGIEDLTKGKVIARVSKIDGIEKVKIKVEGADGKKVERTGYKRI